MSNLEYNPKKVFTVEQVNAMLPLVGAIASDLVKLSREVIERRQRLAHITTDRELVTGNPYDDELALVESELEGDTQRLREYVRELCELGVEPKGVEESLVDFPCMFDGRLVYLCWKVGEPEVLYWHELDAGFAGRQPLAVGTVVANAADSARMLDR